MTPGAPVLTPEPAEDMSEVCPLVVYPPVQVDRNIQGLDVHGLLFKAQKPSTSPADARWCLPLVALMTMVQTGPHLVALMTMVQTGPHLMLIMRSAA